LPLVLNHAQSLARSPVAGVKVAAVAVLRTASEKLGELLVTAERARL
jgi:hypothetical protein